MKQKKQLTEIDAERAHLFVDRLLDTQDTNAQCFQQELAVYMNPFRRYPSITQPEHYEPLFAAYHTGTPVERLRARDLLVYGNARLVVRVALGHRGRRLSLLDTMQEGMIGLMTAIERFEIERGWRFSTYAYQWIRQRITLAQQDKDEDKPYRVTANYQQSAAIVLRIFNALYLKKGRTPSVFEVYQRVKEETSALSQALSLADVRDMLRAHNDRHTVQLDAVASGEEEGDTIGNSLIGSQPKTETVVEARRLYVEYREAVDRIEEAVGKLPPRTAMVMRLRFGLGEFEVQSLEEIAERYELTRERIRQIEGYALAELEPMLGITGKQMEEIINAMEELEVLAHVL